MKTNKLKDFHELGINYWNEWALEDDTVGKSYSYQLAKQHETINFDNGYSIQLDQVNNILYKLNNDPYSRRIMFSYWNPNDVHKKALQECAWAGQFNVRPSKDSNKLQLDMLLVQRSVDVLLGLPSNWAGYYALQCALANVFDYEVGTFTHQMGNVHLYDNQIELAKELIDSPEFEQPEIYVNPEVKYFYDYTVDDIKYINYKHGKAFRSDVAI